MDINHEELLLDSGKNDFIYRFLSRIFRGKIGLITLGFFIYSFGGTVLIGIATGTFTNTCFSPVMCDDYTNLINVGFLTPVGVYLLFSLYSKIDHLLVKLIERKIIRKTDGLMEIKDWCQRLLESKAAVYFCIFQTLWMNAYIMYLKADAWNGMYGGLTAYYFRIVVLILFFYIFLITYKGIITVLIMRKIFKLKYRLDPIHPDKCGGLKPLGEISLSLNYFGVLILMYLTIIVFLEPLARESVLFFIFYFMAFSGNVFFIWFGLSKAHQEMKREKIDFLNNLHIVFRKNYTIFNESLEKGRFDQDTAEKIKSITGMFNLANQLPVWPFDINTFSRLVTTLFFPMCLFLFKQFTDSDSYFYKLRDLLGL